MSWLLSFSATISGSSFAIFTKHCSYRTIGIIPADFCSLRINLRLGHARPILSFFREIKNNAMEKNSREKEAKSEQKNIQEQIHKAVKGVGEVITHAQ